MLRLNPKTCLPDSELANSLKLFAPEFRRQDTETSYTTDPGYSVIDVSWVKVRFQPVLTISWHEVNEPPAHVVSQRTSHGLSAQGMRKFKSNMGNK
jgi:hypothetical protein